MADDRQNSRQVDEWRRAFDSERSSGSGDCPQDDELAALVTGGLDAAERIRVADHVVACRRCADSYAVLKDLDREAGHGRLGGSARTLRWVVAAAASVILVVWLAGPSLRETPTESGVVRSLSTDEEAEPAPGAQLAQPPMELAWTPRPAATYHVRLFDAAAEPVWEQASDEQPRAVLPEQVRSRLTAGASYFWVVEIQAASGPHSVGPYWFSLRERE